MSTHAPAAPSATRHAEPTPEPPPAVRAVGIVAALIVAIAVVALAFALPAARSKPHDVPVGVAAPSPAATQLSDQLGHSAPGAFAVTMYADEAALRAAVEHRDVYGGLAMTPQGPTLLVATGGSPVVAQLLTQVGSGLAQKTGMPLHTEDLAPLTTDDPRGTGLAASALPVTLAGVLPAVLLMLALPRHVWTRFAAALVFTPLAGISVAALLRYVLGSVDSNLWPVAGALTLGIGAALLFMLGLGSLFGRTGLVIGGLLALLLGNPLSGLASAPEFLPSGWGAAGQLLPQGATATLLRSAAYFSGAGASTALLVLTCWASVGAGLVVIAAMRRPANV
jgi:hypothetical protein